VKQDPRKRSYVVEDSRDGKAKKRSHDSLGGALRDAAVTWRSRLH
jgi:hypothetical protein